MRKLLMSCLVLLLLSCGKDNQETELELIGTWTLSSVTGTCLGLPTESSGNEIGCIDLPALEVNCSIIEIAAGGTLTYAYDLVKGSGTYTIDGDKINICTDRCLTYLLDGNTLSLQTGTVELCDPTYIFTKTTTSLDELITENQRKFIVSVSKNGSIKNAYTYNPDGSLQTTQIYDNNGNLFYTEVHTYTPLTATRVRTYPSSGNVARYEYYNEAPDRTRRDYYGYSGQLEQYSLHFHSNNGCWADRVENYQNNTLQSLINYTYSGSTCDVTWNSYIQGELTTTYTSQKDGKRYWGESTLLNILQYQKVSNPTSTTYVRNGEVDTDSSFSSTYTYDEGDYPLTEIRTYIDGTVDLYTYTYQ